mgnify:CR=1 FL=1|jgi:hypothetical protein
MRKIALTVSDEVHQAVMAMGKLLHISVTRMGDEIFTTYGKTEFERISKDLRLLKNVQVEPGYEKEAEAMMERLRKDMEPFKALAEIYDREDERMMAAIEADIEEHIGNKGGKKK